MILEMVIRNWLCFGGEHRIQLGPGVHAVMASSKADPSRSNWLGKTSFLDAIRFALSGDHPMATEDEWLNHNAQEGGVELVWQGPAGAYRIERTRKRGKSTQLKLVLPDGKPAAKDVAQRMIWELVGLSLSDADNTCFIRQKRMHLFVSSDTQPAERMAMVAKWFRLEKLQEAADLVKDDVRKASTEAQKIQETIDNYDRELVLLLEPHGMGVDDLDVATGLCLKRQLSQGELDREVGAESNLRTRLLSAQRNVSFFQAKTRYDETIEEGKRLRKVYDEIAAYDLEVARTAFDKAVGDEREARSELLRRQANAKGFDGVCPVTCEECPVTDKVKTTLKKRKDLHEAAQQKYTEVSAVLHAARNERDSVENRHMHKKRLEAQMETLRANARQYLATYEQRPPDAEDLSASDLEDLAKELHQKQSRITVLQHDVMNLDGIIKRVTDLQQSKERMREQLRAKEDWLNTLREASVLFGRNGAQRRIAEENLAEIADGANDLLQECEIGLQITINWAYQGDGLAKTCEVCGTPFHKSTLVKVCAQCGAERGPNFIQKLEVDLSDRSGAAEDLSGGAIQLAASAWLREDRSSAWDVALIDEPFGSLDATHRPAFATHLASMLESRYGFRQAFIVAHYREIMHSLPNRIEILEDGGARRIEVIRGTK